MTTSTPISLCNMPSVLTVDEAAKILRIGRQTAYRAVKLGQLPSQRILGRILVPRAALESMLGIQPPLRPVV